MESEGDVEVDDDDGRSSRGCDGGCGGDGGCGINSGDGERELTKLAKNLRASGSWN